MATLVLTAVGTAVAGPIGGAIGALVGQRADQAIFAPKARHGPRLNELAVQTSSYGTAIPKIFGTMRVAGTVIWATPMREQRTSSGGGKGKPKTVSYSYSIGFAVAISGRPVREVRRIWGDGKLLRGAAGDFKTATGFRLHRGDEDQEVDPLIAAAEGAGSAPAYRGLAYAVFEDFQLEAYGNRIPSLTFEVEADAGAVSVGAIAQELGEGTIEAGDTPLVHGFAASGDSVRGVLQGLSDVMALSLADTGERLRLAQPAETASALARTEECGRRAIDRRAEHSVPDSVSITYHDPAREYQTGLQRASGGAVSSRGDELALPAVIEAGAAKAFAEARLAAVKAARTSSGVELPWARAGLRPGSVVTIEGEQGRWKIERWRLGRPQLSLQLRRVPAGSSDSRNSSAGRSAGEPDILHGPTELRLVELPGLWPEKRDRIQLCAAAAGASAAWRRAAFSVSFDGGQSWHDAGASPAPAVMGRAVNVLGPAGSALFDDRNVLEVELVSEQMWLEGRTDSSLAGGANLALLGNELIQFGSVEPLGDRRFRLSRHLRGRRGSEWAAAQHVAGAPFLLIEEETLVMLDPPIGLVGGSVRAVASSTGDAEAAEAELTAEGEALRPPSPVHLNAELRDGGDIALSWVRRSRDGWAWTSGSDTPLAEETELYELTLGSEQHGRTVHVAAPYYVYTAAQRAEDGHAGPLAISIRQIGTFATSRAASILFG